MMKLLLIAVLVALCNGEVAGQSFREESAAATSYFAALVTNDEHGRWLQSDQVISCSSDLECEAAAFCNDGSQIECNDLFGLCDCGALKTYLAIVLSFFVISLLALVLSILALKRKEQNANLPPHMKTMDCAAITVLVILTLCMGLIGLLIGYCIYYNQINQKIMYNNGAAAVGGVGAPVAVVSPK